MNKLLIAVAALSLTSCGVSQGLDNLVSSPAPCSVSVVDERALVLGLQTFDTVLTAVDKLITAKVIVPGSPRAVQIADVIRDAKLAFQSASAAQRACNTTSYLTALGQAQTAVARINTLVRG